MKRYLLLLLVLFNLTLGFSQNLMSPYRFVLQCAAIQTAEFQIGAGTSTSSNIPAYGLWDYSFYGCIWLDTEFTGGASGEIQITGIEVEVQGYTTPYTYLNQYIYFYHVTEDIFDSSPAIDVSDLTTSDQTLVVSGYTFTISSNGWQTITFDTPFCYNGTDNLLMVWENRDGSWASNFGQGKYDFSPAINRAAQAQADDAYPTGNGTRTNSRINIKFKY